jgi:hypothetical protein
MMTKSFHKLPLTILAITMILSPHAYAEVTESSKICATYTADYKHLSKSLVIKQNLLEEYQKDFQLLQEKLLNISSFNDSLNQQAEKFNTLEVELNRTNLGASDQTTITIYNKKVNAYNEALAEHRNDIDKWNSELVPKKKSYAYQSNIIEKSLKVLRIAITEEKISMNSLESSIMGKCILADKH